MPATASKSNNVASDSSAIKFKQDALSLWSTIKDATNKEYGFSPFHPFSTALIPLRSRSRGRLLATEFLRLPSKRQYADYYQQIQNPIALDEIKSRIETGKYPNLDAVRQDLELCFKNAKKYNMKDSPIWKDAKHLHVCLSPPLMRHPTDLRQKLVNKEYSRLTGESPGEAKAADAENDGDAGSGDEAGKKKKTPNLSRVLKSRLQKLVDKTADECVSSCDFPLSGVNPDFIPLVDALSLPSSWSSPVRNCGLVTTRSSRDPSVLKTYLYASFLTSNSNLVSSPSPQKKLKRKEYHTSSDFSKDVQLVFSNAMEFNSEGSQIHEDAQTLKVRFSPIVIPPP